LLGFEVSLPASAAALVKASLWATMFASSLVKLIVLQFLGSGGFDVVKRAEMLL
jgi:hypothetical protein